MATKGRSRKGSRERDPDGVIANRVIQDIINNSTDQFREYLAQRGTMPPTPYPAPGSAAAPPVAMAPTPYPGQGSELSALLGGGGDPGAFPAQTMPQAPMPPVPYLNPSPQGSGVDPSLERLLAYFGLI